MSRPVVLAAGGTGGHMFPALALAAELERRGTRTVVTCDRRGARYLGDDVPRHVIDAASPSGGLLARLGGYLRLARGFAQSVLLLRRLKPGALAVFGGYAAVPVGLAAQLLGLPVLVHEQNAVLGRGNRLIARRARRLALTFEATRGAEVALPTRRVVTGNPVRAEVAALRPDAYRRPGSEEHVRVLVVGGSQGARIFSDVVPAGIAALEERTRRRLALTQQCRAEDLERVAQAYAGLGFAAELASFFDDLPARMAEAHLVISRSGASSVAELLALGRPSLLVPYGFAADDHQRANAEVLGRAGAARLIDEADLTAERVAAFLEEVLTSPDGLADMAASARRLGRGDAAAALADTIVALSNHAPAGHTREAVA